jgi:hypothetical protein
MIAHLQIGDPVRVWPKPGLRVLEHPGIVGRFLSEDGAEVRWSTWMHDRVMDGSVSLVDPRPAPQSHQPSESLR